MFKKIFGKHFNALNVFADTADNFIKFFSLLWAGAVNANFYLFYNLFFFCLFACMLEMMLLLLQYFVFMFCFYVNALFYVDIFASILYFLETNIQYMCIYVWHLSISHFLYLFFHLLKLIACDIEMLYLFVWNVLSSKSWVLGVYRIC